MAASEPLESNGDAPQRARHASLDLLRGAAAVSMIIVNTQFRDATGFAQLRHPPHLGLALADLVMPTFSLLAGAGIPHSVARAVEGRANQLGHPPTRAEWAAIKRDVVVSDLLPRSARLFALGALLSAPFTLVAGQGSLRDRLASLRVWGVLQRHAAAYLISGVGYLYLLAEAPEGKGKEREGEGEGLLAGLARKLGLPVALAALWLVVSYKVPFPNTDNGPLPGLFPLERVAVPERTAAYYLDAATVGLKRMYNRGLDPEGLLGILTGVTNVWAGALLGQHLITDPTPSLPPIFLSSLALLSAGYLLSQPPFSVPLSKKLWTPSFALVSSGASLLLAAAAMSLERTRNGPPSSVENLLVRTGRNTLTVYAVQSFVPHILAVLPSFRDSYLTRLREATVSAWFGKNGFEGLAWGGFWAAVCVWAAERMRERGWAAATVQDISEAPDAPRFFVYRPEELAANPHVQAAIADAVEARLRERAVGEVEPTQGAAANGEEIQRAVDEAVGRLLGPAVVRQAVEVELRRLGVPECMQTLRAAAGNIAEARQLDALAARVAELESTAGGEKDRTMAALRELRNELMGEITQLQAKVGQLEARLRSAAGEGDRASDGEDWEMEMAEDYGGAHEGDPTSRAADDRASDKETIPNLGEAGAAVPSRPAKPATFGVVVDDHPHPGPTELASGEWLGLAAARATKPGRGRGRPPHPHVDGTSCIVLVRSRLASFYGTRAAALGTALAMIRHAGKGTDNHRITQIAQWFNSGHLGCGGYKVTGEKHRTVPEGQTYSSAILRACEDAFILEVRKRLPKLWEQADGDERDLEPADRRRDGRGDSASETQTPKAKRRRTEDRQPMVVGDDGTSVLVIITPRPTPAPTKTKAVDRGDAD
ncbi:hypothetical protein DFJ74DRAFT_708932 [Hyaloraphidium curvatum]|nr:hypothetical protein DFJ74DRAFT_708932 [Hyaloraphidium curvatum]